MVKRWMTALYKWMYKVSSKKMNIHYNPVEIVLYDHHVLQCQHKISRIDLSYTAIPESELIRQHTSRMKDQLLREAGKFVMINGAETYDSMGNIVLNGQLIVSKKKNENS